VAKAASRRTCSRRRHETSPCPRSSPTNCATASRDSPLPRAGQPIGPHDILIAATALAAQATLVTRNVAEFSRVLGLRLENWFD